MQRLQAHLRTDFPDFSLDVQLDLPGRGISALFGPSGCGKTTTLRAVAGLHRARGSLHVEDRPWQDDAQGVFLMAHRRPLGYVFQDSSLFPHLSVRSNVEFGMRRVPAAQRRVALEQAVDLLAIGGLMQRKPDTLSGGERQRVAIARALATSPRLLLLDEPLAALDAARKAEVLPYLERLHRELDIPVLYVSHAIEEVARLADTVVLMERGRVLACGPVAQTLARLDLPLSQDDAAGVLLHGRISERDPRWHLARVSFEGGELWARDDGIEVGQAVRLRVLGRDVSIAMREPGPDVSSIQNALPCTVQAVAQASHPSQMMVRLDCGGSVLLARITTRAVDGLGLVPGRRVWAQVKSVALVR
ncbi:MAG: molybdenum ABC transporter ATP-binding protein [Ramlibacter sp.]